MKRIIFILLFTAFGLITNLQAANQSAIVDRSVSLPPAEVDCLEAAAGYAAAATIADCKSNGFGPDHLL